MLYKSSSFVTLLFSSLLIEVFHESDCTSSITVTYITYLAWSIYLYNNCDTFLTVFILTHPVNFSCGRKPERKPTTFGRALTDFFSDSYESVARIEATISEVKGDYSDPSVGV
jgi:hypothetical protein